MERDELRLWLRLQMTPGVGNATARRLLGALGLPEQVFQAAPHALSQLVSDTQAAALREEPPGLAALCDTTWQWLQADPWRHRILVLGDPLYPASLLETDDPPLLLYGMGAADIWLAQRLNPCHARSLAVVGSRNPSAQGLENARLFARALAQRGWTIVSGLAWGIDGAAHAGALEGAVPEGVATVAVVGTGLDRVYPRQHRDLAHRIAEHGVLLSEYPLGTPPLAPNFPKRNRLISGLSRGTLVVEAALQSGSLITARLALDQGREVFAIPGSIHTPQARGCHALIKQGAKLVESAQDILEELHELPPSAMSFIASKADSTGDNHENDDPLLEYLGFDAVGLDALLARTGLDTAVLQAQLMELEIQGAVVRLPGGLFQRVQRA